MAEIGLCAGRELVVAPRLGDTVLTDFVEQGLIADLEERGCLFAVPIGLFKSLRDCGSFGFVFRAARQGLESAGR